MNQAECVEVELALHLIRVSPELQKQEEREQSAWLRQISGRGVQSASDSILPTPALRFEGG